MRGCSTCGFPLLYLFVNTYTGESRWLSFAEGSQLCEDADSYWVLDESQKPIAIR